MEKRWPLVIGLIGGIGVGKSRVAAAFARRGAKVVSGDEAGHEALRQPEVLRRVVERWGPEVLGPDGAIDRRRVAARVFADPAELKVLQAITWPWIEARLRQQIDAARAEPGVRLIVLDAAVLLEAGWDRVCDRVVYVDVPRAIRLRRLAEGRGWSAKEVEARERAQLMLSDKASRADDALDNSGTPEALDRQADTLLRRWGLAE
jgi:dephospho-CoA kinase